MEVSAVLNKKHCVWIPLLCTAAQWGVAAVLSMIGLSPVRTTLLADALAIGAFVFVRRRISLGFRKIDVPMGVLGGYIAIQIPVWLLLQIGGTWIVNNYLDTAAAVGNAFFGAGRLEYLALCLFVAPVTEELLFRGIWLPCLGRTIGLTGSCLLTSLVFGLLHGNLAQGYVAGCLGLLYGIVTLRTGNVRVAALLHMIANGMDALSPAIRIPESLMDEKFWIPASGAMLACLLAWTIASARKRAWIEPERRPREARRER